ncbi:hypothetical protein ACFLZX_03090 [Nanoarchaeota archaeon]
MGSKILKKEVIEMDSQELGGNIILTGFSDFDGGTMIILKKIIGNYAKDFSEQINDFEKLHLKLNQEEQNYLVEAIVTCSGSEKTTNSSQPNIFMGVDNALKEILKDN